ncbi:hypothetical protein WMW72_14605 [Paenibacillus filicis]|uniref:Transposase n=1 Tax=Paenibacillus filicis TaxID=669464 RepID=A0ABU9DN10_9BACL
MSSLVTRGNGLRSYLGIYTWAVLHADSSVWETAYFVAARTSQHPDNSAIH